MYTNISFIHISLFVCTHNWVGAGKHGRVVIRRGAAWSTIREPFIIIIAVGYHHRSPIPGTLPLLGTVEHYFVDVIQFDVAETVEFLQGFPQRWKGGFGWEIKHPIVEGEFCQALESGQGGKNAQNILIIDDNWASWATGEVEGIKSGDETTKNIIKCLTLLLEIFFKFYYNIFSSQQFMTVKWTKIIVSLIIQHNNKLIK